MPTVVGNTTLALIALLVPVAIILGLEARRRLARKRRAQSPLETEADEQHQNGPPRSSGNQNSDPKQPTHHPRRGMTTPEGLTTDQINENARAPRARLGLTAFRDLDTLDFPGYYVAHLDYFATGEGRCQGLRVGYYRNADELRSALLGQWGEYLAKRCEILPGTRPLENSLSLLPLRLHERLLDPTGDGRLAPRLIAEVTIHETHG